MKNFFSQTFWLFAFLLVIVSCQKQEIDVTEAYTMSNSGDVIEGQYIFTLDKSLLTSNRSQSLPTYEMEQNLLSERIQNLLENEKISAEILSVYTRSIVGFAAKMTAEDARRLDANRLVLAVEEDKVVALGPGGNPGPPNGGGGGGGNGGGGDTPPAQETPWGISRVGGNVDATGLTAWVIDSGIDLDHEDLNVDVARSASFLSGGGANSADDQNGHGTHVAGTIAALNNSLGVVGVAPNASVVSIRVLDRRGSGSTSGVIAGVDYVAANGANGDVANMSLGGGVSTALDNAVSAAASGDVKFVLAAGNESDNANNHSPARVNGNNIYTISAMDINDNFAYFSNYGSAVDYCAPGVNIHSTWKSNGYNTISGTSMAAPHVAGLLLIGNLTVDGYVNGDPDGNADPIAHH